MLHFFNEINAIKKHKNATSHILKAHNQALSYICIENITNEINHQINQDITCGFDSHFIILLKYIKYEKNVKIPDNTKNK